MRILLQIFCILSVFYDSGGVDARKTYIVKERINKGDIVVHQPRVQATDIQFCLFKDSNNDWCIDMDENWKLSFNNLYTYD